MKIHEYQAKALFGAFAIPVLQGRAALSVQEARQAAQELGGGLWVVKSQIHAGGRGKAGGVKLAHSPDEVASLARQMLGSVLVTHQTGAQGRQVQRLYIEQGADIRRELYAAVLIDRQSQLVCMMASAAGGMDIEETARTRPQDIARVFVSPTQGPSSEQIARLVDCLDLTGPGAKAAADFLTGLYRMFMQTDASLVEVNPMAVLGDGSIVALDAKMSFDDSALFRHPELEALRDLSEEEPLETQARRFDLSYIALNGTIACMVNGAGLAMATMDSIKLYGGEPANFLDVGGGATVEKVTAAFEIMLSNPKVEAVLVNIFGGIMRCDTIAEGIVGACRAVRLSVPLIVRMNGTNEDLGRKVLADSGLSVVMAADMAEAAQKAVAATKQQDRG